MEDYQIVKDRFIVCLEEGVDPSSILNPATLGIADVSYERLHQIKLKTDLIRKERSLSPDLTDEAIFAAEYPQMPEIEKQLYRTYKVKVPAGTDPAQLVEACNKLPGVTYAELSYYVRRCWVPNDPLYKNKDAFFPSFISCEGAWDITRGEEVIIAISDWGLNITHPDIMDNLWEDDDGHHGYNFIDNNYDLSDVDKDGHGSHVTGIAAAVGNNSRGITGVAPKAKIMVLKKETADEAAAAYKYAADQGAKVINESNDNEETSYLIGAIDFIYLKNVLLVAAAGNENSPKICFPARFGPVISVGSVDGNEERSSFSNYGAKVDVAAPGEDVYSLARQSDGYVKLSGTSMAAPMVSGVAALLYAANPGITNYEVKKLIVDTSVRIKTDQEIGGIVNAYRAISHGYHHARTGSLIKLINKKGNLLYYYIESSGIRIEDLKEMPPEFGMGFRNGISSDYSCMYGVERRNGRIIGNVWGGTGELLWVGDAPKVPANMGGGGIRANITYSFHRPNDPPLDSEYEWREYIHGIGRNKESFLVARRAWKMADWNPWVWYKFPLPPDLGIIKSSIFESNFYGSAKILFFTALDKASHKEYMYTNFGTGWNRSEIAAGITDDCGFRGDISIYAEDREKTHFRCLGLNICGKKLLYGKFESYQWSWTLYPIVFAMDDPFRGDLTGSPDCAYGITNSRKLVRLDPKGDHWECNLVCQIKD